MKSCSSEPPVRSVAHATTARISVVIPCFKVGDEVLNVIRRIGPECWRIYVVDDACPHGSGIAVQSACNDRRVRVLRHQRNEGVGGAVITGYRAAIAEGATVIVKIDGDGQMPPELIRQFVAPILAGNADYTKGNRFYDLRDVRRMPVIRIIGNAALSFMAKLSSGYWDIFDPANGYTAIHAAVAARLPFDRLSRRYFFETDMLFRLNTLRVVVVDVPMMAVYADETSNLRIGTIWPEFLYKHARNTLKRVFYNYFLRDFTVASLELVVGLLLLAFGIEFGVSSWLRSMREGVESSAGTVMLAGLPTLVGLQLLLAFVGFDTATVPRRPIHPMLQLTSEAIGDESFEGGSEADDAREALHRADDRTPHPVQ